MKKIILFLFALILAFSVFAGAGEAQEEKMTAEKIVQRVIEENKKQMTGVNDMTVIMDNMEMFSKFYGPQDEKTVKTRMELYMEGAPAPMISIFDGEYIWNAGAHGRGVSKQKINMNPHQTPIQMAENLKNMKLKYERDEIIEGVKNYVLSSENLEKMLGQLKPDKLSGQKLSGKIWVDSENLAVTKMEMDYDSKDIQGQEHGFKTIVQMKDFKRVKTLNVPHRIVVTLPSESLKITPEQREGMEEGLRNLKKQLESMPPDQKEMMEKMLAPQIKQMEKMLDGGSIEHTIEIKEVRVNTRLSEDLFNPELLPGYSEKQYDKQ